jgi:hypothetical protein
LLLLSAFAAAMHFARVMPALRPALAFDFYGLFLSYAATSSGIPEIRTTRVAESGRTAPDKKMPFPREKGIRRMSETFLVVWIPEVGPDETHPVIVDGGQRSVL